MAHYQNITDDFIDDELKDSEFTGSIIPSHKKRKPTFLIPDTKKDETENDDGMEESEDLTLIKDDETVNKSDKDGIKSPKTKRVRRNTGIFRTYDRSARNTSLTSPTSPKSENLEKGQDTLDHDGNEYNVNEDESDDNVKHEKLLQSDNDSDNIGTSVVEFQDKLREAEKKLRRAGLSVKKNSRPTKNYNDEDDEENIIDESNVKPTKKPQNPKKKQKNNLIKKPKISVTKSSSVDEEQQQQEDEPDNKNDDKNGEYENDPMDVDEQIDEPLQAQLKNESDEELVDITNIKLKPVKTFKISGEVLGLSKQEESNSTTNQHSPTEQDKVKKIDSDKTSSQPKVNPKPSDVSWTTKKVIIDEPKKPKILTSELVIDKNLYSYLIKTSKKTFPYDNVGKVNVTNMNQRLVLFFNYISGDFKNNCMMTSIRSLCIRNAVEFTRTVLYYKEIEMFPTSSTSSSSVPLGTDNSLERNIEIYSDAAKKAIGFWKHLKKVYKLYCQDIVSVFEYKKRKLSYDQSVLRGDNTETVPLVPKLSLKDPNLGPEFEDIDIDFNFFYETEDRFGTKAVLFEHSRMDIQILSTAICSYFKGGYQEMLPVLVNIRTDTRKPLYHQLEQLLTHFFVLLRKGFRFGKTFYLGDAMGMGKTFQHILSSSYTSNLLSWLMLVQTMEAFDPLKLSIIDFETMIFEVDSVNTFYEWISMGFYAAQDPAQFKAVISEFTYNRSGYECFKTAAGYLDYLKSEIITLCNKHRVVLDSAKDCKSFDDINTNDLQILLNIFKSIKLLFLLRSSSSVSRKLDGPQDNITYEAYLERSKLANKREKCLNEIKSVLSSKADLSIPQKEQIAEILFSSIHDQKYWYSKGKPDASIGNYFSKNSSNDQIINVAGPQKIDVNDNKKKKKKDKKSKTKGDGTAEKEENFDEIELSAMKDEEIVDEGAIDGESAKKLVESISLANSNLRKIMDHDDKIGIAMDFEYQKDILNDNNVEPFDTSSSSSTTTTTTSPVKKTNSSDAQGNKGSEDIEFRHFFKNVVDKKNNFFGNVENESLLVNDGTKDPTYNNFKLNTEEIIIDYMKKKKIPFKDAVIQSNRHILGSNNFTTFVSWAAVPKQFIEKFLPKKQGFLSYMEQRDETIYEFIREIMGVPTRIMDFVYDSQTFGKSVSPLLFCPARLIDEWIRELKNVSMAPRIAILAGESLNGIGKKNGSGRVIYVGSNDQIRTHESLYSPDEVVHCKTVKNYLTHKPTMTLIHFDIMQKMIGQVTSEIDLRRGMIAGIYCSDEDLERHCEHVTKAGVRKVMLHVLMNINQYIKLNFFAADMMSTFRTCKLAIQKFDSQFQSEKKVHPNGTTIFMKNLKWAIEGAELFLKTYDNIGYWFNIFFSKFSTVELEMLEPGITNKSKQLLTKVDEKIQEIKNIKDGKMTSSEKTTYIRELETARSIVTKHIDNVIKNIKNLKRSISQSSFEELPALSLYFMSNEYNIGVDEAHKLRTETAAHRAHFLKFPSSYRSFLSGTLVNNKLGEEIQSFVNLFRSFGPWIRDRELSLYDIHKPLNFPEVFPKNYADLCNLEPQFRKAKTPLSDKIISEFDHDLDTISKLQSQKLSKFPDKPGSVTIPFKKDFGSIEMSSSSERMILMMDLLLSKKDKSSSNFSKENLYGLVTSQQFANLSSLMWYNHLPKTLYNRGVLTFSVSGRHIRTALHISRPKSTYLATVQDKMFFHSCGVKEYHMGPAPCDKETNSINVHGDTVLIYDLDPIFVRRIMGKPWFSGGISLSLISSMNASKNGQNICHACGSTQIPNSDYEENIQVPIDIGGESSIFTEDERRQKMIKDYSSNETLKCQDGAKESLIITSKKVRNLMYNVMDNIKKSGKERSSTINKIVKEQLRLKGVKEILPVELAYQKYLEYKSSWGCKCFANEKYDDDVKDLVKIFDEIIGSEGNQPKSVNISVPTQQQVPTTTTTNLTSSTNSSMSSVPISFLNPNTYLPSSMSSSSSSSSTSDINNLTSVSLLQQIISESIKGLPPRTEDDDNSVLFAAKMFSFVIRFVVMRLQKNFGGCIRNSPFGFYADSILSDQTSRAMDSLQTMGLSFVGLDVKMVSRLKTIYNASMVHVGFMKYLDGKQKFSLEEFKNWYYTISGESQTLPYFTNIETDLGFFKKIFPSLPFKSPEEIKPLSEQISSEIQTTSTDLPKNTPITDMITFTKDENGKSKGIVNFSGAKDSGKSKRSDKKAENNQTPEEEKMSVTQQKKKSDTEEHDDVKFTENELFCGSNLITKLSELFIERYLNGLEKSKSHRHVPHYRFCKKVYSLRFFMGKAVSKPKKYTTVFNEYERVAFLYYHGKDKDEQTEDLLRRLENDPTYASRMSNHSAFSTINRFVLGAITNCISVNSDYRTKIPRSYPSSLVGKSDEEVKQSIMTAKPTDEFLELSKTVDMSKSRNFARVADASKNEKIQDTDLLSFCQSAYDEKMIDLFLSLGYKGSDTLDINNGLYDIEKLPSKYLLLVWFLLNKTNVVQTRHLKQDGTPIHNVNVSLKDFKDEKPSKKKKPEKKKKQKKSESETNEEPEDHNPGEDEFINAQMGKDINASPDTFDEDRPDSLPDRVVVFTQNTLYLDSLAAFLEKFLGIRVRIFAGSNTEQKDQKSQNIRDFKAGLIHVLIGTFASLGHGVNLDCANVTVTYEGWWNPQVEEQAKDRIRRISQKRSCRNAQLTVVGGIDDVISYVGDAKALGAVGSLFRGQSGIKRSTSNYVEHVLFDRPSLSQIFFRPSKDGPQKFTTGQLNELFSKRPLLFRAAIKQTEEQTEEQKKEVPQDALKLVKPMTISTQKAEQLLSSTKKKSTGYYENTDVNCIFFNTMWKSVVTEPSVPNVSATTSERKLLNIYLASRFENRQHNYEDDIVNNLDLMNMMHNPDEIDDDDDDVPKVTEVISSDDESDDLITSDSTENFGADSKSSEKKSKKNGNSPKVSGEDSDILLVRKVKKNKKKKKSSKKGEGKGKKRKHKSGDGEDGEPPKKKSKKDKKD